MYPLFHPASRRGRAICEGRVVSSNEHQVHVGTPLTSPTS